MKKTTAENTGAEISCIGVAATYLRTNTDKTTSVSILDTYISYGGTYMDTANNYVGWELGFQGDERETLIGRWMGIKNNYMQW